MTPEEEYREELKWILQKIKKELLHAENLVDFNASRLTNRDPDSPSLDVIYKHLKDLERATVIRIVERYDDDFSAYAYSFDAGAGVTGYKFIVDREKFATLYEKYFKPRPIENDRSFDFESEKRDIAAIDSADEYKIITDKWFNIKQILDALVKLLSPIDMNEVQTVTLNPKYLPDGQERLFTSVISDMVRAGVIGGTHEITPPVVVTSALATSVTSGKYIPLKVTVFKAYRKKVLDLVAWIETDRARFSKSDEGVAIRENEKPKSGTATNDSLPKTEAEGEEDDDCFSYDGGLSTAYTNSDLQLFILKKILLEHKLRDDAGFHAKELSFNNDTLTEICLPIELMIEDKILYLSANSWPRREENHGFGIEDKRGFIDFNYVNMLEKNPAQIDASGGIVFDTEVQDEIRLKGRIDIAIEEFMNDRVQDPFDYAYMMDKAKQEEITKAKGAISDEEKPLVDFMLDVEPPTYLYKKQREIVLTMLSQKGGDEIAISLNDFEDKHVDVLKTLLALEKENVLRIKELKSNPIYDDNGSFVGKWSVKDQPMARVCILRDVEVNASVSAPKNVALGGEIPRFDAINGDVIIGSTPCHIADAGDLQYHVCNELLTSSKSYELGKWLAQTVLQDSYARFGVVAEQAGAGKVKELFKSERWLRDAVSAINVKTTDDYGINLLGYKKSQVRVIIELFRQ